MRIKAKETSGQAPLAPAAEAEAAPPPHGKQTKAPRPRPPRSQMAGGCLLYKAESGAQATDTMCDDAFGAAQLPAPAPERDDPAEADGEDRARHLAMAVGQAHPMLRRLVPKPAATLPPVRPGSRLACERRCGGAGCDPTNSHGCGGVFCIDPQEEL
ncbi:hypothetical protein [Duganella sp. Root1480D1]|uniref:hypothetical protein n=1 Tax=Duganella sp. Root1480D1 TaxID=1736471 RepID=UPI00070B1AFB|nr:hypothetical protein [Duganella sp. Root1480D1]KQZ44738.1 hypothetical protein ASD58_00260 [Duganella sp. Root1480D1]